MQKIKYVFVVLTYRNTKDLEEFIASAKEKVSDYQIIVVNSYFDDKSKCMIEKIAKENSCDFINVPNKGYSFGNNRGIEYANEHYDYEFLIVSNPDIIIREFPDITDYKNEAVLLGADITNARQKKQNPLAPWRNRLSEKIIYDAFRKESKMRFLIGVALNRFFRELFLLIEKIKRKKSAVYALHGSFVIFSRKAIKLLGLPYDENMFFLPKRVYWL